VAKSPWMDKDPPQRRKKKGRRIHELARGFKKIKRCNSRNMNLRRDCRGFRRRLHLSIVATRQKTHYKSNPAHKTVPARVELLGFC